MDPQPMEWLPLAQAPETVRFIPLSLNMQERFIVTVEFMLLKIPPLPIRDVSPFSLMASTLATTGSALESFP